MIVFGTTCKGRAMHVKETLPANLAHNTHPDSKFVLLDYSSRDGLIEFLKQKHSKDIQSGRLSVYSYFTNEPFHVAHAKNMCHRLGILEGADLLVTVDADNFTGKDFDRFILEKFKEPGVFLCPDYVYIKSLPHSAAGIRPLRGYAGRLVVRTQDFIKAGGYNEVYNTWRGEDIDFNMRMLRMGYTMRYIDNHHLKTIPHSAETRFKEYPHARVYEQTNAWKIAGRENDTVVSYGSFGEGTVFKNFGSTPIKLSKVPTRVFGIGMHKTATNSLHNAFQILGYDSLHWGTGEAPLIWNEMEKEGRSKTLEKWYAACDLPIPLLYKKLDIAYPGSKFILTLRDEKDWLKSVERLWSYEYNPTRWVWDEFPFTNRIHHALYGQTEFHPELFIKRYRQHNSEVIDYFKNRSDDLLIMNMSKGAGWRELCSFLGVSHPVIPYPISYVTKELKTNISQISSWGGSYE